jgi:hypothetical protein
LFLYKKGKKGKKSRKQTAPAASETITIKDVSAANNNDDNGGANINNGN